jgi:hypothetical protein
VSRKKRWTEFPKLVLLQGKLAGSEFAAVCGNRDASELRIGESTLRRVQTLESRSQIKNLQLKLRESISTSALHAKGETAHGSHY